MRLDTKIIPLDVDVGGGFVGANGGKGERWVGSKDGLRDSLKHS